MTQKIIAITTTGAGTFSAPADWPGFADKIECIGGGGAGITSGSASSGNPSGGAGAYSLSTPNITLANGANLSVGAGGTTSQGAGADTWIGGTNLATSVCGAKGGAGAGLSAGGAGGAAASGIATGSGATKFSGGSGNALSTAAGGAGGGGAGGPNGNGANGGQGQVSSAGSTGAGGGGSGGGTAGQNAPASGGTGGNGGNNSSGSGGGVGNNTGAGPAGTNGGGGAGASGSAVNLAGGNGGPGSEWTLTAGGTVGAGGGGGGSSGGTPSGQPGNGGLYGGGGGGDGGAAGTLFGTGAQGIIVITYTPANPGNLIGQTTPTTGNGIAEAAGDMYWITANAYAGGTATALNVAIQNLGAATALLLGLYGPTGALLASGTVSSPVVGLNTVAIANTPITYGQQYSISVQATTSATLMISGSGPPVGPNHANNTPNTVPANLPVSFFTDTHGVLTLYASGNLGPGALGTPLGGPPRAQYHFRSSGGLS